MELGLKPPKPGSLWIKEESALRWLYIAQEGNHAIRITIRKDTGKVIQVDLEGFIHGNIRELKIGDAAKQS
jgi:hypothetical protein